MSTDYITPTQLYFVNLELIFKREKKRYCRYNSLKFSKIMKYHKPPVYIAKKLRKHERGNILNKATRLDSTHSNKRKTDLENLEFSWQEECRHTKYSLFC